MAGAGQVLGGSTRLTFDYRCLASTETKFETSLNSHSLYASVSAISCNHVVDARDFLINDVKITFAFEAL